MTSAFIPHNRPSVAVEDSITNPDAFYPNFSVLNFRSAMRVDDTVTDSRCKEQLLTAIRFINAELNSLLYREQYYPNDTQLPIGVDMDWYITAVYHRAKAYIIEQYHDIDTAKTGQDRADNMEARIDVYLQRSREVLRQLLHRSRATIKLI